MMIASHLKSALRNATGSALYSIINVGGLSIGLACCLLILLFVRHELSYESAFANADRIYRVSREIYPFEGARARVPATAYVAMNRWLENFAYRIDLTPLIFIGSGLIALSIAWATVGGTAAKAANAKPVLALRYE